MRSGTPRCWASVGVALQCNWGRVVAAEAVLTLAFDLPAESVFHAVAPSYFDGERHEAATLKRTYILICKVLAAKQIRSLTLPSLGTGIYRFPLHLAATIACETLDHLLTNCEATIIGFDQETVDAYHSASTATFGPPHSAPLRRHSTQVFVS